MLFENVSSTHFQRKRCLEQRAWGLGLSKILYLKKKKFGKRKLSQNLSISFSQKINQLLVIMFLRSNSYFQPLANYNFSQKLIFPKTRQFLSKQSVILKIFMIFRVFLKKGNFQVFMGQKPLWLIVLYIYLFVLKEPIMDFCRVWVVVSEL